MYNVELIKMIFDAANIQRWNDHVRTQNFTELDKQAHKMLIAYVLARHEEDAGAKIDWQKIIEAFQKVDLDELPNLEAPSKKTIL